MCTHENHSSNEQAVATVPVTFDTHEFARISKAYCPDCGEQSLWVPGVSITFMWHEYADFAEIVGHDGGVCGGRYSVVCEKCGSKSEGFIEGYGFNNAQNAPTACLLDDDDDEDDYLEEAQ